MLDRQVGNALARIDAVRAVERLRRTGVEAPRGKSAMLPVIGRRIRLELEAGQDHAEEQPAAMLAADTRLVCLPCQPMPAAWASGFSITGAVSTNTFSSRRRPLDDEPRERLQRLLDRLVIVAALRIDRDRARSRAGRRAPAGPLPAHSSSPARSPISPRATARAADTRWSARLFHPAHRPVVPRLEPAPEVEPGRVRRIGAREPAGHEAEPLGLGPYCFLKALAVIHVARHYTGSVRFP